MSDLVLSTSSLYLSYVYVIVAQGNHLSAHYESGDLPQARQPVPLGHR